MVEYYELLRDSCQLYDILVYVLPGWIFPHKYIQNFGTPGKKEVLVHSLRNQMTFQHLSRKFYLGKHHQ